MQTSGRIKQKVDTCRRRAVIRVLIVDDSAVMRDSLSILLERQPNIEVAGTASDGLEAVEKFRAGLGRSSSRLSLSSSKVQGSLTNDADSV